MEVVAIRSGDDEKEHYHLLFINGDFKVVTNGSVKSPVELTIYEFDEEFTAEDMFKSMAEQHNWEIE